MTNLWEETLNTLRNRGKTFDDVLYIQRSTFSITKENFKKVAKDTIYNNGFGGIEVAEDLVIVGDNWWLERDSYDGAEWWSYKEKPNQIITVEEVKCLADWNYSDSLAEMNEVKNES